MHSARPTHVHIGKSVQEHERTALFVKTPPTAVPDRFFFFFFCGLVLRYGYGTFFSHLGLIMT